MTKVSSVVTPWLVRELRGILLYLRQQPRFLQSYMSLDEPPLVRDVLLAIQWLTSDTADAALLKHLQSSIAWIDAPKDVPSPTYRSSHAWLRVGMAPILNIVLSTDVAGPAMLMALRALERLHEALVPFETLHRMTWRAFTELMPTVLHALCHCPCDPKETTFYEQWLQQITRLMGLYVSTLPPTYFPSAPIGLCIQVLVNASTSGEQSLLTLLTVLLRDPLMHADLLSRVFSHLSQLLSIHHPFAYQALLHLFQHLHTTRCASSSSTEGDQNTDIHVASTHMTAVFSHIPWQTTVSSSPPSATLTLLSSWSTNTAPSSAVLLPLYEQHPQNDDPPSHHSFYDEPLFYLMKAMRHDRIDVIHASLECLLSFLRLTVVVDPKNSPRDAQGPPMRLLYREVMLCLYHSMDALSQKQVDKLEVYLLALSELWEIVDPVTLYVSYDAQLDSPEMLQMFVRLLSKLAYVEHADPRKIASLSIRRASVNNLVQLTRKCQQWPSPTHSLPEPPSTSPLNKQAVAECLSLFADKPKKSVEALRCLLRGAHPSPSMDTLHPMDGCIHPSTDASANPSPSLSPAASSLSFPALIDQEQQTRLQWLSSPPHPEDLQLAILLRFHPLVDRRRLGDLLSTRHQEGLLYAYLLLFDMRHVFVMQALRQVLMTFRLPGEAALIQRILEYFAGVYSLQNGIPLAGTQSPSLSSPQALFQSSDAVYVIVYAVIMLNTNRYHPRVPQHAKMDVRGFIKSLQGTNDGHDYPADFLRLVYASVEEQEIRTQSTNEEEQEPFLSLDHWRRLRHTSRWVRIHAPIENDVLLLSFGALQAPGDFPPHSTLPASLLLTCGPLLLSTYRQVLDKHAPHPSSRTAPSTTAPVAMATGAVGQRSSDATAALRTVRDVCGALVILLGLARDVRGLETVIVSKGLAVLMHHSRWQWLVQHASRALLDAAWRTQTIHSLSDFNVRAMRDTLHVLVDHCDARLFDIVWVTLVYRLRPQPLPRLYTQDREITYQTLVDQWGPARLDATVASSGLLSTLKQYWSTKETANVLMDVSLTETTTTIFYESDEESVTDNVEEKKEKVGRSQRVARMLEKSPLDALLATEDPQVLTKLMDALRLRLTALLDELRHVHTQTGTDRTVNGHHHTQSNREQHTERLSLSMTSDETQYNSDDDRVTGSVLRDLQMVLYHDLFCGWLDRLLQQQETEKNKGDDDAQSSLTLLLPWQAYLQEMVHLLPMRVLRRVSISWSRLLESVLASDILVAMSVCLVESDSDGREFLILAGKWLYYHRVRGVYLEEVHPPMIRFYGHCVTRTGYEWYEAMTRCLLFPTKETCERIDAMTAGIFHVDDERGNDNNHEDVPALQHPMLYTEILHQMLVASEAVERQLVALEMACEWLAVCQWQESERVSEALFPFLYSRHRVIRLKAVDALSRCLFSMRDGAAMMEAVAGLHGLLQGEPGGDLAQRWAATQAMLQERTAVKDIHSLLSYAATATVAERVEMLCKVMQMSCTLFLHVMERDAAMLAHVGEMVRMIVDHLVLASQLSSRAYASVREMAVELLKNVFLVIQSRGEEASRQMHQAIAQSMAGNVQWDDLRKSVFESHPS